MALEKALERESEAAAPPPPPPPKAETPKASASGDSDLMTDDEFDKLLDDLHGDGKGPSPEELEAATKPVESAPEPKPEPAPAPKAQPAAKPAAQPQAKAAAPSAAAKKLPNHLLRKKQRPQRHKLRSHKRKRRFV